MNVIFFSLCDDVLQPGGEKVGAKKKEKKKKKKKHFFFVVRPPAVLLMQPLVRLHKPSRLVGHLKSQLTPPDDALNTETL